MFFHKDEDAKLEDEAFCYIKKHKKSLFEVFANDNICPPSPFEERSTTFFMAGSPGAGKTEFSKSLLSIFEIKALRIDADDIRAFLPQYTGKNSNIVQKAANKGVEMLYDYALDQNKNIIFDATFAVKFETAIRNVERSLNKNRFVHIFYIYQDPILAWEFTKKREAIEGRYVPKEVFIDAFFQAKDNVNDIKKKFGNKISVSLVVKNFNNGLEDFEIGIEKIDNYIDIPYNKHQLYSKLS